MTTRFQLLSLLSLGLVLSFCSNTEPKYTLPPHPDDIVTNTGDYTAKAGKIELTGSIDSDEFNGEQVLLYQTEGREIFLVDSALVKESTFAFQKANRFPGLYKIGLKSFPDKMGQVILNPSEKQITLSYRSENFNYGLTETNSIENKALKSYIQEERKYQAETRKIKKGRMDNSAKKAALFRADENLKKQQDAMANQYPGTFFANMVSHLQSAHRFDQSQYWDDIDFTDKSLIHSMVFPARIEDYMRTHASKGGSDDDPLLGFYNAVDLIANKIKDNGDDDVLSFVLYTMSEGFYSSNMEALSLYVIDNYFYGDGCGDADINALIKARASGIRNLQIGQTPPDFELSDPSGKLVSFTQTVDQNNYTLLLFWASFCHKCEEEIPSLKPVYAKYKSKGLEIIGVSVDDDAQAWIGGITKNEIPWLNVSELKGWQGQISKDYRISSTPIFFLVDHSGQIVARPKSSREIEQWLGKLLR